VAAQQLAGEPATENVTGPLTTGTKCVIVRHSNQRKPSPMKTYQSYLFRDKDPVIDRLRTIIADQGVSRQYIENKSGVSERTLYAWFNGETKRPQHCTIAAVAAALGFVVSFTPAKPANVVPIHKKAR